MEMQIRTKRLQPLNERITTPVSTDMKNDLEMIKRDYRIDVNEMVRLHLNQVIQKVKTGEFQRPA